MKGLSGIALSTGLLIVMISASGCVCGPVNDIFPFQIPFIATPTPTPLSTPLPTVAPTPTPQATVIVQQTSYDVRIHPAFITFESTKYDMEQTENITVLVINDGNYTVENIKLILSLEDAQRSLSLITQEYDVGDLTRGDRKIVSMDTSRHAAANSVYVTVRIVWGKYGEYSNPDTFINRAWTVW